MDLRREDAPALYLQPDNIRGPCPFEALWMERANLDPLGRKFGRHHSDPVQIRADHPGFIDATKVRLQTEHFASPVPGLPPPALRLEVPLHGHPPADTAEDEHIAFQVRIPHPLIERDDLF